ncbi:MAG: Dabb family protein [Acidobacteria bacterium]|nr:Dabb family protein [Acidobacteriota bacterium]
MVIHLVLFRPRPDLEPGIREALFDALRVANEQIPSVRRFSVGRRVSDGPTYVMRGFPDFPYAAVVEFDDRDGLEAYLAHPAHDALGRHFNAAADAALIYDYEVTRPEEAARWNPP